MSLTNSRISRQSKIALQYNVNRIRTLLHSTYTYKVGTNLVLCFINRCYVLVSGSVCYGKYAKKYSVQILSHGDVGACVGSLPLLH